MTHRTRPSSPTSEHEPTPGRGPGARAGARAGAGPPLRLVLASASPRRRALLAEAGFDFEPARADVDERPSPGERPGDLALRLALAKARAVAAALAEGLVLGADTIVVFEGRVLGKPVDAADARSMLSALRGRRHVVMTAVAVVDAATGACAAGFESTGVWMRAYGDDEVERYIASGDPFDKAGAYAVQHPDFAPVLRLQGSACTVIGLPIALARRLIERAAGGRPLAERRAP